LNLRQSLAAAATGVCVAVDIHAALRCADAAAAAAAAAVH